MEIVLDDYISEGLPKGWKPYYIFLIVQSKEVVGRLVLREGSNEERYFDGHIGYTIDEPYRGHNYAYKACSLVKEFARKKGFKQLIITCNPDNIPSKKTILKLDGKYLETKTIPNSLKKDFKEIDHTKEIYIIDLMGEDK